MSNADLLRAWRFVCNATTALLGVALYVILFGPLVAFGALVALMAVMEVVHIVT